MTEFHNDCLVLKIEEYDIDDGTLDTTLYIIYDKKEEKYVIRGKRYCDIMETCTYSFNCEFAQELFDFICNFLYDLSTITGNMHSVGLI